MLFLSYSFYFVYLFLIFISPFGLGGVEYTNCISAERWNLSFYECDGYGTESSDG